MEQRKITVARRRRRRPPGRGRRAPARPLAHRDGLTARWDRARLPAVPFIAAAPRAAARPGRRQGVGTLQASRRPAGSIAGRARESHHYVLGLNFLVANQLDLAIEELGQAARIEAEALEVHLMLGNLYRENGQVSRAIRSTRRCCSARS